MAPVGLVAAAAGWSSMKGVLAMTQVEARPQVARKGMVAGPVEVLDMRAVEGD